MSSEDKTWSIKSSIDNGGEFKREVSQFREAVTKTGLSGFPSAKDRYHLYVSLACPWAHRTLIMRKVKGLDKVISVNVVHYHMTSKGWHFDEKTAGATADTVHGRQYLKEVYLADDDNYTGRITVPVLYDKVENKIVNNESSEILRMLNSEFNDYCPTVEQAQLDFYPQSFMKQIDDLNEWIYHDINNGVYKCGFATTQAAYDKAVTALFSALDKVEGLLGATRYIAGNVMTEADIRLYTTLVRFDAVYVGHFKCNVRRIVDYPNIWNYLKDLYQSPGFGETTNLEHIKRHYYESHGEINKYGIVPAGPELDFTQPHDRNRFN